MIKCIECDGLGLCPACNGSGLNDRDEDCRACEGFGTCAECDGLGELEAHAGEMLGDRNGEESDVIAALVLTDELFE